MDYEKAVKNAKWFAVGILVLTIILFLFRVLFLSTPNIVTIVLGLAQIAVIIATITGLNSKQRYGAICGIIVSVLLILNFDILDIILGILYLIDCIKILDYMKNK